MKCQLACKPGSVHMGCPMLDDHSSGAHVTMCFVQPTRAAGRKSLDGEPSCHPYSVLLQVGFTWPTPVTRGAVRSYRTFSPLPRIERGGLFLWHFPWGCPRRTLSGTFIPWSPDFPPSSAFRR